jgi:hypothetical protein
MSVTFAIAHDPTRPLPELPPQPDLDAPDTEWDAWQAATAAIGGPEVNVSNSAAVELLELLGFAPWNHRDPRATPAERSRLLDDLSGRADDPAAFRLQVRMQLVKRPQQDRHYRRLTDLLALADAAIAAGRPIIWS